MQQRRPPNIYNFQIIFYSFSQFLSFVIIYCLSTRSRLSSLHISWSLSLAQQPDSCNMFSFSSHPTLPIFILDSITFGFSRDSFCTVLLSDACCYPTDLCQSWRMAVLFSAWIAVLVALYAFKSSRQMCVKDVWTTQPSNPSRHSPLLSHPAVSMCITMICHASCFDCLSMCVCVCALVSQSAIIQWLCIYM